MPDAPSPSEGVPAKATSASKAPPRRSAPNDQGDAGLRVLCVDDHALLVQGLKAQFAIEGRIRVVGHLSTADGLLEEVARLKPDVVLLDIDMPGPDVFETADRMRHEFPRVRFVFLSAHVRDGYLAAAYKCGAWGYLSKSDELDEIVNGITEVGQSRGGTFVMGPKVRERCGAPARTTGERRPSTALDALTSREVEVLRLIGKGHSRVEIAKELCRSAKTIDGHQERMMKKLGISSRAELMRFAIREGFAEA